MAITIGQSKNSPLNSIYSQSGSTIFNKDLSWLEGPVLGYSKPSTTSENPYLASTYTKLRYPLEHRAMDAAKVAANLGRPGGIWWLANTVALNTIQQDLNKKKAAKYTGGTTSGNFLKNLGAAALDTAEITAATLAQVALGNGPIHLSAKDSDAYINSGRRIFAIGNTGDNSLGVKAQASGKVVIDSVGYGFYDKDNEPETKDVRTIASPTLDTKNGVSWPYGGTFEDDGTEGTLDGQVSYGIDVTGRYSPGGVGLASKKIRATKYSAGDPAAAAIELPLVSSSIMPAISGSKENYPDWTGTKKEYEDEVRGIEANKLKNVYELKSPDSKTPSSSVGPVADIIGLNRSGHVPVSSLDSDSYYEANEWAGLNLIPFQINVIKPGQDKKFLRFEANLENYNDNYTGNWSDISYIGRADKFFIYNGFTREISFKLNVVARRPEHLKPIYTNLNNLAGTTAPTYGSTLGFMRGTFVEVTIGDLLYEQTGYIKSVQLSWDTDVQWEIDNNKLIVPQMLSAQISFTPIHSFNPTADSEEFLGNINKTA